LRYLPPKFANGFKRLETVGGPANQRFTFDFKAKSGAGRKPTLKMLFSRIDAMQRKSP